MRVSPSSSWSSSSPSCPSSSAPSPSGSSLSFPCRRASRIASPTPVTPQVVAAHFQNDVQSAELITTSNAPSNAPANNPAVCGSGFQVLGLELGNNSESPTRPLPPGRRTASPETSATAGPRRVPTIVAHDVPSSMLTSGGETLAGVILTANSTSVTISGGGSFTGVSNGQYLTGEQRGSGYVRRERGRHTHADTQPVARCHHGHRKRELPTRQDLVHNVGRGLRGCCPNGCARLSGRMGDDRRRPKVTFATTEPESNYTYKLVGVPIAGASTTNLAPPRALRRGAASQRPTLSRPTHKRCAS